MNLLDHLMMTFRTLFNRPVRTGLTLIGIFIGVAAVVSLISLGQGLQDAIKGEFEKVGGDKLIVQGKGSGMGAPGTLSSGKITEKDVDIIERTNGISKAAGVILKGTTIEFNKKSQVLSAFSLPDKNRAELVIETGSLEVEEGRMIKEADRGKAVIGKNIADHDYYAKVAQLGDTIKVNNTPFKIVGLLKSKGDPGVDSAVIVNEGDLRPLVDMSPGEYSAIYVRVSQGVNPEDVAPSVLRALRKERKEKEGFESVEVQTMSDILQTFNSIFSIVEAVLVGIAGISFIVGAVGIMNTMYTSVVERTREIGIMKAVGASNAQVVAMFLVESGVLGFLGGLLGAAIGAAMSKTVEVAAQAAFGSPLIHASYPPVLILGSIALATLIGMASGFLPSLQAARQKPVDAIRYD